MAPCGILLIFATQNKTLSSALPRPCHSPPPALELTFPVPPPFKPQRFSRPAAVSPFRCFIYQTVASGSSQHIGTWMSSCYEPHVDFPATQRLFFIVQVTAWLVSVWKMPDRLKSRICIDTASSSLPRNWHREIPVLRNFQHLSGKHPLLLSFFSVLYDRYRSSAQFQIDRLVWLI